MRKNGRKATVIQKTLKGSIECVGIGLHSGCRVSMVIRPGEANTGVYFIRKDVPAGRRLIRARWYNVVNTVVCTVIGNEHGVTVASIDSLMASLRGCGIDNAVIEIDGPEVPIIDVRSESIVSHINRIGMVGQEVPRSGIWIHQPIEVREGDKRAMLLPSREQRITVEADLPESAVSSQTQRQALSVELLDDAFHHEINGTRTFEFTLEMDYLCECGKAGGGSLQKAILIDGDQIVNEEGVRFKDHSARHEILDTLGDLALVGFPILGHFYGNKPARKINNSLIRKLFTKLEAWTYLSIDEFNSLMGKGKDTG